MVDRPTQLALPANLTPGEIARERTFGGAIDLCAKAAGFELDKQLTQTLGFDKAQFSRWQSNTEGITWPKLVRLMDVCGNDAPILWMVDQRGYDITTLRRKETALERELRLTREELEQERQTVRVLKEALNGR